MLNSNTLNGGGECKRLAIQFFGHTRTYKKTYESFFKYIVEPNKNDGWEIDIFIHTWDMTSSDAKTWHSGRNNFIETPLTQETKDEIKTIYNPKVFVVEHLEAGVNGRYETKRKTNKLREKYEIENNIKYDYILYARLDILFAKPLRLQTYIDLYNNGAMKNFSLPEKHCFAPFNPFFRMPVIDMRYVNEGDILYFANHSMNIPNATTNENLYSILIDYRLHRDFFLQRENFVWNWDVSVEHKLEVCKNQLIKKETELNESKNIATQQQTKNKELETKISAITAKYDELKQKVDEKELLTIKILEKD
ncbi:hypothetical protein NYG85_11250, partial [Campylobacter sp. PS10]|nr:hypothetical protein [Campylobacter gastrosuis]